MQETSTTSTWDDATFAAAAVSAAVGIDQNGDKRIILRGTSTTGDTVGVFALPLDVAQALHDDGLPTALRIAGASATEPGAEG